MKNAEEYSSIIEEPSLARKLLVVIEKLLGGETLREAARKASLGQKDLERLLGVLGGLLEERACMEAGGQVVRRVIALSDGASRGNPGEAACAAIIYDEGGGEILRRSRRLGRATNNVAEYEGVLLALGAAKSLGAREVILRLDSSLIVNQINGKFKVKNRSLKPLYARAKEIAKSFSSLVVEHVPRDRNREADRLANAALDGTG